MHNPLMMLFTMFMFALILTTAVALVAYDHRLSRMTKEQVLVFQGQRYKIVQVPWEDNK
jgi:hypothetical protein